MSIPETIKVLQAIIERCDAIETDIDTVVEVDALREAISYLTGVAFRTKALNIALDLCQGRHKNDYTDAFDSDIIVEQARNFENYLAGTGGK